MSKTQQNDFRQLFDNIDTDKNLIDYDVPDKHINVLMDVKRVQRGIIAHGTFKDKEFRDIGLNIAEKALKDLEMESRSNLRDTTDFDNSMYYLGRSIIYASRSVVYMSLSLYKTTLKLFEGSKGDKN